MTCRVVGYQERKLLSFEEWYDLWLNEVEWLVL